MSTFHATLTPNGDWETNVKSSWQSPPEEPFLHRTCSVLTAICPKTFTMAEDPKENAVGEKIVQCSNAQSLRIYWAGEGEGARGHQSQRGAIPTSHISNRFYSMNWTRRTRSEAIASKHPWPKRSVTCSIEILSMTKFIESMCDWKVDSSSSYFFVTTRWHVCSCQLSERTGLISIVNHIIFRAWPACCNCW